MLRLRFIALTALLVTAASRGVFAQQAIPEQKTAPRIYLQAGILAVTQPAHNTSARIPIYTEGTARGFTVGAGVAFTPSFSIDAELITRAAFTVNTRFTYDWRETYTADNDDTLIVSNLRWTPRKIRFIELSASGGMLVAKYANRNIIRTDYVGATNTPVITTQKDVHTTERGLSLGLGLTLVVPLARHVALVPTFAARTLQRNSGGLTSTMGAGSHALYAGVMLRIK